MSHMLTILTFFKYALLICVSIGLATIITYPAKAGKEDDGLPSSSTISVPPASTSPKVTSSGRYYSFEDSEDEDRSQKKTYIPFYTHSATLTTELIKNAKSTDHESEAEKQKTTADNVTKEIELLDSEIDKGSKLVEKEIEECNKEIELWDKDQEDNQQDLRIHTWPDLQEWDWDSTPTTSLPSTDWDNSYDGALQVPLKSPTSLPGLERTPPGDYSHVPVNKGTEEVVKPNMVKSLSGRKEPVTIAPILSPNNLDLVSPASQNSKDIPQKKAADEDQGFGEFLEAAPTLLIERPSSPPHSSQDRDIFSIERSLPIESNHSSRRNSSTSLYDNSTIMNDSGYQDEIDQDQDNSSKENSPIPIDWDESFSPPPQIQGLDSNFPEREARILEGTPNVISPLELEGREPPGKRAKRNLSDDPIGQMPLLGAGGGISHPTTLIIEKEAPRIPEASSEQADLVPPGRENLGEERSGAEIIPLFQERTTPTPPTSPTTLEDEHLPPPQEGPAPRPPLPLAPSGDDAPPAPLPVPGGGEPTPLQEWPASPPPLPTGASGAGAPSPATIGPGDGGGPPPPKIIPNYYFTDIVNIIRFFINNRFTGASVFPIKTILSAGEENDNIQRGIWISGLYGFIKQRLVDNAAGYTGHNRGGNIGFDAEINNNLIGIAYSNVHSIFKCKTNQVKDRGIATSHVFSIYGQKNLYSNFTVQGLALVSRSDVNNITPYLLNNTQYHLTEKYRVTNYSLEALLNYQYPTKYNLILAPNIGLRYGFSLYDMHNNLPNLLHNSKSRNMLTGIIGTKLSLPLKKITDSISLGLILQGGIEYNFNPKAQQITRTISVGNFYPIQNYILSKPPKTTYNVGASLVTHIKNLQISLEYHYHLYKRYYSHHGIMKFKVNF